jgi:hypothetical protein
MIVAEIKTKQTTDKEDWHILSNKHPVSSQVTYILSLGVFKDLRRLGIGKTYIKLIFGTCQTLVIKFWMACEFNFRKESGKSLILWQSEVPAYFFCLFSLSIHND